VQRIEIWSSIQCHIIPNQQHPFARLDGLIKLRKGGSAAGIGFV
jgi:hypothetical protein